MSKIEHVFETKLEKRPKDTVRLIVRVTGDIAQAKARLSELDIPVLRSFQLINAVAISCTAEKALALLREPWVETIEEDRQVFAQRQNTEDRGKGGRHE
ncbi:MAG: hypothetical protein ACUVR2_04470 [Anaerolineae bacterium]